MLAAMNRLYAPSALALALTLTCATASVTHAQDQGEDSEARALFEAGRVAFDEGRFENALEYFERSYELSRRPQLLYNIGSAADRLRRDEDALEAFEAFLEAVPTSPNRAHVEGRIRVLRSALGEEEQEAPAEATAATSSSPSTSGGGGGGGGIDPAPWIVVGISGAVLITGVVLLGVSAADIAAVENVEEGGSWSSIQDAHDRAPILSGLGWAFAAVGLAGAAVGLGWGIASGSDGESVQARIVPGGLELRGTF